MSASLSRSSSSSSSLFTGTQESPSRDSARTITRDIPLTTKFMECQLEIRMYDAKLNCRTEAGSMNRPFGERKRQEFERARFHSSQPDWIVSFNAGNYTRRNKICIIKY
ncbi:hypothetical protein PUN28_011006 [Cardiocondyla obscurior]|uniref:Uncharacterized protein n=1 Tax=Cardiocondyla obscurior TaxID=286306 RepID=A0AAW2FK82_9HYME